jgi:hypothetical protein
VYISCICKKKSPGRRRNSAKTTDHVQQDCLQNSKKPTGRAGSELSMPQQSEWTIIWQSPALRPYLLQMLQNLSSIPKDSFRKCVKQWQNRRHKCIASEGAYFEGD